MRLDLRLSAPLLAICVLATTIAGTARADTIDGTVSSLMVAQPNPRDGQVERSAPLLHMLQLRGAQIANPVLADLGFVLSGWVGVDFGEPRDGHRFGGDLNVAFLQGSLLGGHLRLRAGRQLLIGGSARNLQFDGLTADVTLWGGFGLSLYGGAPVTPRFGNDPGDVLGGSRVFWRDSTDTELGVSFLHLRDKGEVARQELGLDARVVPVRWLSAGGHAFMDTLEWRMAEADVGVQWLPSSAFEVTADYRHVSPDLFVSRTSIFSVFSQEQRDEVGASAFFEPVPRVELVGDYHTLLLEQGTGHDTGLDVRVSLGRGYQTRVGVGARYLRSSTNGYVMGRLTGSHQFSPRFRATLEAAAYLFDQPINGHDVSFTTRATIGWELAPRWHALLSGLAGATPYLSYRTEVLAALGYEFSFQSSRPAPRPARAAPGASP